MDLVFVRLCSCVYRLDPSDLRFSSSATDVVLVHWSYGALARRLPDCLLQQVVPGSGDGGVMTTARLAPLVDMWMCAFGGSIFGGFVRISSLFVYVRVSSDWIFLIYVILICGGCCSGALVLRGLSTTTSRLSTTTSCARLRRWRADDGGAPSARFSAGSRR